MFNKLALLGKNRHTIAMERLIASPLRVRSMRLILIGTIAILAGFTRGALAQPSSPVVFGGGYANGGAIMIAPGQVIPFYLSGLNVSGGPVSATTLPLPYTLAGISAVIDTGAAKYPVPIFSVDAPTNCPAYPPGAVCQTYTSVTVEIPVEMVADLYLEIPNSYTLYFSDALGNSALIPVQAFSDQIHILSRCNIFGCIYTYTSADGSTPSMLNAGDTIVIYAYGLGYTTPAVPSGTATPSSPLSSVLFPISVNFDFAPNAAPPRFVDGYMAGNPVSQFSAPAFAGLVPGYVGLYQVNVTIPEVPAGTPACGYLPARVSTNLTISLIETWSVDGIGVCVNPPPGVTPSADRKAH